MISLLLVSYLAAIAQDASTVGSASSSSPLSISLETGRYDPEPGCKKEVDGCFPKLWTPERQFKVGSQVWVKITVVNHSDQVAVVHFPAEFSPFSIDVVESAVGRAPKRTKWGCWMKQSSCPPATEALPPVAVHGTFWEIPHGKSNYSILEITREYEITNPGEYTVSVETGGFELAAPSEGTHLGISREQSSAKHLGTFKTDEVRFQIVN